MAPQNQQRSLLATLLAGGVRNDPYANERSGPFASSPRVYGAGGGPQISKPQQAVAARAAGGGGGGSSSGGGSKIPVPILRPAGGGGNAQPVKNPPLPLPRQEGLAIPRADIPSPVPQPRLWDDPGPYPGAQPATGVTVASTPYEGVVPATGNTIPTPVPQSYAGQDRMPNIPGSLVGQDRLPNPPQSYAGQDRIANIVQSFAGQDRMPNVPGRLVGQDRLRPGLGAPRPDIPGPVPQYPYRGGIPPSGVGVPQPGVPGLPTPYEAPRWHNWWDASSWM